VRLLFACLIACAVATAAFAQDKAQEPTLAAKSRSVEVEITIDEKLRADARLYRGLVKAAQQFIDERALDADKAWREDRVMFRHGPWSYERGYYFEAEAGPYISVSVLDYSYTGGAHPNNRTHAILWDRDRGRRATIADLFREAKPGGPILPALAARLREEVAKEKRERDAEVDPDPAKDEWLSAIKPDLKTMGAAILVPSIIAGKVAGIVFHFSQYDVGAYAEGAYDAFLSWRELEPFLTEQARAWFGGERADVAPEPRN
jgi:hypothetical protein